MNLAFPFFTCNTTSVSFSINKNYNNSNYKKTTIKTITTITSTFVQCGGRDSDLKSDFAWSGGCGGEGGPDHH